MRYEVKAAGVDEWVVEAIDYENDGAVYRAAFTGPDAEKMATEYAEFRNWEPCACDGCNGSAAFAIYARRSGGGTVGPDPYADETFACTEHVGELLNCQDDAKNPDDVEWLVMTIEAYQRQTRAIA